MVLALQPPAPVWSRWQRWLADDALWPEHVALVHDDLHPGHLGFNAIGDAGLAAIARSPHLAGLRSLQLRGCRYGAAGLQVLANEATCVGLETLDLSYCEGLPASDPSAGAAGWRALVDSSRLPALHQLSVAGNAIPDDIQAALARWTASSY